MRKWMLAAAAAALMTPVATQAVADFPERDITMLVAYSAGGGTDTAARAMVPFIEKYLGNDATINVVNKPGAGGEIGFTELAQAKPDGYTIGWINIPSITTKLFDRETRYNEDSYTLIANIVYDPGAFSVATDSPFKTMKDVVDFAKENPRVVTVGISAVGGDDHLTAITLQRMTGAEFTVVPFRGGAPTRSATMGGHVAVGSFNIGEAIRFQDRIRVLAQFGEERWRLAPDIPTGAEAGFNIVNGSSRGIAGPAGMPADITKKISDALAKVMEDPEFKKVADERGLPLDFMPADEYAKFFKEQVGVAREIWENTPWR